MADLDGLIDSKISLISQEDIKFDGTLFSINAEESSMVLKDVQCLGTEDRVTDPAKMVPANASIIPFVTFPGGEIKDLIVHDPTPAPAPSAPVKEAPPKAPQQQRQQRNSAQQQQQQTRAPNQQRNNRTADHGGNQQKRSTGENAAVNTNGTAVANREPRNAASGAGTGAYLSKLREKKSNDGTSGTVPTANTASEFDFSAGLNMFKKDDVLAKVADENEGDAVATKYVKDDFFDSLSCDIKDRQEGRRTRMSASEERSLNQDTFGAIALQGNANGRRYYGGGGRGGRGGGRGRGGGGGGGGRGYYSRGGGGRGRGRGRGNSNSAPVNA